MGVTAGQPRVRGEHSVAQGAVEKITGSAPRARGTHLMCGARGCALRSGQPRVRGEHVHPAPILPQSQPRVSPACAGNTRTVCVPSGVSSVPGQPRVRGEHHRSRRNSLIRFLPGQPRVRGEHIFRLRATTIPGHAPRVHTQNAMPLRVSPACAGNTRFVPLERLLGAGSAPRARGTPLRTRFTVPIGSALAWPPAGQPRVRGEHSSISPDLRIADSGQPRVRGEHWVNFSVRQ